MSKFQAAETGSPLRLAEEASAPSPTPQQIEADWLHQDEKRLFPPRSGGRVTPAADAAGGVDGVKNGQCGFHTDYQPNPWWQVDLQRTTPVDRVVLYNRCDGFAERNARIRILVSEEGKDFRLAYQNPGLVFYGFTDQKPLVARLGGVRARFIRLTLPGTSYFHLDEVEVYAAGENRNLALGKPATQSSVSQWSVAHLPPDTSASRVYPLAQIVERGLKLADKLRSLGVIVTDEAAALEQVAAAWRELPPNAADSQRRVLYLQAHWKVRRLALRNPLLNFDAILFVKRAPTMFPHLSDQHYGWWSRPGGGLFVLEGFKTGPPRVRCLTDDLPPGSFIGPDLSCDGRRVLFAYCQFFPHVADLPKVDKDKLPAAAFYHIYEMNLDGTGRRQLTQGRYDDFDPRYLPNGEILFLSTRKGLALQVTPEYSDGTRAADLPDSYVRCGGDSIRPVPVFTLHGMDANGQQIHPLSAFENFEWSPSVASDGRILYTRWDYIDRFNGHFFSLWSANQDGTNPQLVYGNYTTQPQVKFEARSIPGSAKLVITAGAHHSITGGSLCLLDRSRGTEFSAPITRLTPEVCFPEAEGWPEHYYANPWPLSEDFFLVAWADRKMPPHARVTDERNPVNAMGLYLLDAFGDQELLYRDPEISSMYPLPVAPRPVPPVQASVVGGSAVPEGQVLLQDVYQGLEKIARGSVKQLRLVAVPPKVQPYMNNPVLGVSAEDPGKFVLGTVPVEADGSAFFRLPAGVPVFFQALDEHGLAVQTMRSLTYVMPNQSLACVGCHEHRDTAPRNTKPVLAALRPPSRLTSGPSGAWPLQFDQLVQPVLERRCVTCHRPGSGDPAAAQLDLTGTRAYQSLLSFGGNDLKQLAFERDRSVPGEGTTARSRLWRLLTAAGGHAGVRLEQGELSRFATWMDTYAQRVGHFSPQQAEQIAALRTRWADLLNPRP